jgi:hypothetical protein
MVCPSYGKIRLDLQHARKSVVGKKSAFPSTTASFIPISHHPHSTFCRFLALAHTMISTATDGLVRRRGRNVEREQQKKTQRATGNQPLSETILPIPMAAVAMSGVIFLLASLFVVWYHLNYHDEDDDE